MSNLKINALALFLEINVDDLEESTYDDNLFLSGDQEYLVVTNDEADELWNESLDSYIDELILPDLNERYRNYFDIESWKEDARQDGRGHCLSVYDGYEHKLTIFEYENTEGDNLFAENDTSYAEEAFNVIDEETFYIYRTN